MQSIRITNCDQRESSSDQATDPLSLGKSRKVDREQIWNASLPHPSPALPATGESRDFLPPGTRYRCGEKKGVVSLPYVPKLLVSWHH